MPPNRDYLFLQPGTVVRDMRAKNRWGIILSADPDLRHFTLRWRGEGDEPHVPWTVLVRAAQPCADCGARADDHKTANHEFVRETY